MNIASNVSEFGQFSLHLRTDQAMYCCLHQYGLFTKRSRVCNTIQALPIDHFIYTAIHNLSFIIFTGCYTECALVLKLLVTDKYLSGIEGRHIENVQF